jgi:predicted nucleotidyltransferase
MELIQNKSSLVKVKPEYQNLLNQLKQRVENHFGNDLCAYYLLGSVGRGEDIPGVSDIDTIVILNRSLSDDDEEWEKAIAEEFEPQYPSLSRLDISCIETQELNDSNAKRLRFIFKTDGVLICGQDITSAFTSYPAGLELAKLLNANYRKSLEDIRKDILEPDEYDKNNPNHLIESVRWTSKKVLRLCLGIIMVDEEFYTRNMQEIAAKFCQRYPMYREQTQKAFNQYLEPTNNINQALNFINAMADSIYQLGDVKFK